MTTKLTGKQLSTLMRRHRVTIRELSKRMGITMKRIREVRRDGLDNPGVVRDWVQGILGRDPLAEVDSYRINSIGLRNRCSYCQVPLGNGDEVYSFDFDPYCSMLCVQQSQDFLAIPPAKQEDVLADAE